MRVPLENRYLFLTLTFLFAYSISRTINVPNHYAVTQWLTTYEFGFIKRGLPGTLLHPLIVNQPPPMIARWITAIAFFALLVLFGCILYLQFQEKKGPPERRILCFLALLILLSSPAVVFLGHTIGYFDVFVFTSCIVLVPLIVRGKIALSSSLLVVTFAIHELIVFVGFPALLAGLLLQLSRQHSITSRSFRRPVLILCMPLAVCALGVAAAGKTDRETVLSIQGQIHDHRVVPGYWIGLGTAHLRIDAMSAASTTLERIRKNRFVIDEYPLVIPSLLACILLVCLFPPERRRGALILLLLAGSAPMLLHVIASDSERIYTFVVFNLCLFALMAAKSGELRAPDPGSRMRSIGGTLLALSLLANLLIDIPLMNEQHDGCSLVMGFGDCTEEQVHFRSIYPLLLK